MILRSGVPQGDDSHDATVLSHKMKIQSLILICKQNACQGVSKTGSMQHPGTHRAPTDLLEGCSRGQVPAECLCRNEKKAGFSFYTGLTIFIVGG